MSKLTIKQENFCLEYIKTGNASEAYRRAYNSGKMKAESINRNAKAMLDHTKIASRLTELRAPIIEKSLLTVERHLDRLEQLSQEAEKNGWFAPAIMAEVNRGKVLGFYVERKEIRTGTLAELPDEDLDKQITSLNQQIAELQGKSAKKTATIH